MRAVLFILKLGLKILAAPVVLALMLFTWLCFGLLYMCPALSSAWPPQWWRCWGSRCL